MAKDDLNLATTRAADAYLAASHLAFAYRPGRPVLEDLSLDLARGRLVCLIGPNGSGKTALLRLLVGLLEPSAGEVRLAGRRLLSYPRAAIARRIAFVPQETLPAVGFTVLETVLMGRSPHTGALGFETAADWHAAHQALRSTDADQFTDRILDELSGGERQRVVIARALAQEPELLLLDEPTTHLDINHQVEVFELLARLNRERGLTVLAISHDVNVCAEYCRRLMVLKDGRLVGDGAPAQLLTPALVRDVYGAPVNVLANPTSGAPLVAIHSPRDRS